MSGQGPLPDQGLEGDEYGEVSSEPSLACFQAARRRRRTSLGFPSSLEAFPGGRVGGELSASLRPPPAPCSFVWTDTLSESPSR